MKRHATGLLSAAAVLLLAGCSGDLKKVAEDAVDDAVNQAIKANINEQDRKEVLSKKYLVILQNMNNLGCNDLAVQAAANHLGLLDGDNKVIYTSDKNPAQDCTDYSRTKNDDCVVKDAGEMLPDNEDLTKYAGDDRSCLLGVETFKVGQAASIEAVVTKPENDEKTRYILLVNHINPDLCGGPIIYPLADKEGYKNVDFYGTDHVLSCTDREFQNRPNFDVNCTEYDVRDHKDEYPNSEGNTSCVVGTDTKPEKK